MTKQITAKILLLFTVLLFFQCGQDKEVVTTTEEPTEFEWMADKFADIQILRYQVNGWDKLSLSQKRLVYYLTQAGLAGRDIMYEQNYRHNLPIRKALDQLVEKYNGDRNSADWNALMTYAKRVWFSSGIHHHYSTDKFLPEFQQAWFTEALQSVGVSLDAEILTAMFDPAKDAKKVNLASDSDLLLSSAVNFYAPDIKQAEVEAFYKQRVDPNNPTPVWHGLNSRIVRGEEGKIKEDVYHADGLYGKAIQEIIRWLELAAGVAENEAQKNALQLLIEYYRTGDLQKWDEYNIAWVQATEGDVDYINGFIEVYNDPLGYRGSYESIVQIKDFEASERMSKVSSYAQWFEDNMPYMPEHRKENVVGIVYNVVTVAGESGDASPATPIGVNLPNSDWIREKYGSKSVSLGNITEAYNQASGPTILREFAFDEEVVERGEKWGAFSGKMMTALHEVIGHASGKLNPGVGTPKQTLKNYASALEEARADLVALYFIMDPKMMELGWVETMDVGKAQYDQYINNGMMIQLRRIEPGNQIEQAHMRNRQLVSSWVVEKGEPKGYIKRVVRDNKTYFQILDYDGLRSLFGELLKEIQRIKSEGDFAGGQRLIETYGVKIDPKIHQEVLDRMAPYEMAPYYGFINPVYEVVEDEKGEIIDIKITYPNDFVKQMLDYGRKYSHL